MIVSVKFDKKIIMKHVKEIIFGIIASLIGSLILMHFTSVKPPKPPGAVNPTRISPTPSPGKKSPVSPSKYGGQRPVSLQRGSNTSTHIDSNPNFSPDEYYQYGMNQLNENNYAVAASLIKKAANKNYTPAESELAFLYEQGLGLPHSLHDAFSWYLKAAENGDESAQEEVAGMYKKGIGVKKNKKMACYWAAKSGNPCKKITTGNTSSFGITNVINGIGAAGKVLLNK